MSGFSTHLGPSGAHIVRYQFLIKPWSKGLYSGWYLHWKGMGRRRECQNWPVGHSSDMPSTSQFRPSCGWLGGLQSKRRKLESDLGGLRLSWVPRESAPVLSSSARAGVDTVSASSLSCLLRAPCCLYACVASLLSMNHNYPPLTLLTLFRSSLSHSAPPQAVPLCLGFPTAHFCFLNVCLHWMSPSGRVVVIRIQFSQLESHGLGKPVPNMAKVKFKVQALP